MDAEDESLVRVSSDKLPGHTLGLSMQKVWEVIREQKDLNLPAHKVTAGITEPELCCFSFCVKCTVFALDELHER